MNDEEKSTIDERLRKAAPLIKMFSGSSVMSERARHAVNHAIDQEFPLVRELSDMQMECLLLKLISEQHGTGSILTVAVTKAGFRVGSEGEGAILAIIAGLEERSLIQGRWQEGSSRMVKHYALTASGHKRLDKIVTDVSEASTWVEFVLRSA